MAATIRRDSALEKTSAERQNHVEGGLFSFVHLPYGCFNSLFGASSRESHGVVDWVFYLFDSGGKMTSRQWRLPLAPLHVLLSALCLLQLTKGVAGTLYLPTYNKSYSSVPALFGVGLKEKEIAKAYLQTIEDWPLLCEEEGRTPDPDAVVTPDDGSAVALLVERGECTFWEKGQVASSWRPPVQYVIIYDNIATPQLVPMSSDTESNMTLFFVSYYTGKGMCKRWISYYLQYAL